MRGNNITLPTWRWLKVNYTDIDIDALKNSAKITTENYTDIPKNLLEEIDKYPHGFSEDKEIEQYINHKSFLSVDKNENRKENLRLSLNNDKKVLVDRNLVEVNESGELELLYDYNNEDDSNGFRASELNIIARENSKIKLYIVQRHNENTQAIQSVSVLAYENACVDIVEIEAGAKKTYFNFRATLLGDNSSVNTSAVYLGYKDEYLNLFYNCDQLGKNTKSDVVVKGALKNTASKVFKAALDFKKGSTGSEGNEEEFVTLLDESVHSIAVPLLLCTEDDVVGNHASSAGKIDQDILFYIMSRGISKVEAEKLIVESNIRPVLDKLNDDKLKDEIWKIFERKLSYE